jgi:hypothetical protein
MGPRAGLDTLEMRKIFWSHQESSPGFRGVVCGPEVAHLAGGCVLLKLG